MIDVETWKDLHELYPKNPKILENIVAQLDDKIARQQTRINSMQRKIDRYKKYARIKHRKEKQQAEERQKAANSLLDPNVPTKGRFVKVWKFP